jgi:FAD:protein FMN transferase
MELLLDCFPALGTAWWVETTLREGLSKETINNELIAHLTTFEARYSRFKTESLVGRLNNERVLKNPDPEFVTILEYGQSLYRRTEGTFNFLVGSHLVARGYGSGHAAGKEEVLPHPERDLVITKDSITLHAGSVDVGGFGKGYLIDELAALVRKMGIEEFLINGGGDLYASHDTTAPLLIHLEHPTLADTYLGTTSLFHQGFAASSPYKRVWKQGEKTETHIVGATQYASFVKAASARDADAFATAALFLDDSTIRAITTHEGVHVARFHPQTNQFSVINFDFTPLSPD